MANQVQVLLSFFLLFAQVHSWLPVTHDCKTLTSLDSEASASFESGNFNGKAWVVDNEVLVNDVSIVPLDETTAASSLVFTRDAMWRWCDGFVSRFGLCPWARASVETENAIQLFFVDGGSLNRPKIIEHLAHVFMNSDATDPQTSIYFVVFLDEESKSFDRFYQWYVDYEEFDWDMDEWVTMAPFHPNWMYSADERNDVLNTEKRSPYPTVSLVATETIARAGEAATRRIAESNEMTLRGKALGKWDEIYNKTVFDSRISSHGNEF